MSRIAQTIVVGVALAAAGFAAVNVPATALASASAGQSAGSRWTLDFKPGPVRLYVDPKDNKPYWYFTYQVVNRSGADRMWAPHFELVTDDGQILVSGRNVPSRVAKDVIAREGNPLIENQNQIIGELLEGAEHAKDGLIVFPAPDLNKVTELSMFVAGLSGESTKVADPKSSDEKVLRKTLKREYVVPGDPLPRGSEPVSMVRESWVMR